MSDMGHNSGEVDAGKLTSVTSRIISHEETKRQAMADIAEVYAEAKSDGLEVPAIREFIKRYFQDEKKRQREALKLEMARFYAERVGQMSLFD